MLYLQFFANFFFFNNVNIFLNHPGLKNKKECDHLSGKNIGIRDIIFLLRWLISLRTRFIFIKFHFICFRNVTMNSDRICQFIELIF